MSNVSEFNAGISPPCETCGSQFTTVKDKRDAEYNRGDVRRRRECLECGGRFTTWEIGKESYTSLREDRLAKRRAIKLFQKLANGEGIDRFSNFGIISVAPDDHEKWNDSLMVSGIEYGAMIAIAQIFNLSKKDLTSEEL